MDDVIALQNPPHDVARNPDFIRDTSCTSSGIVLYQT